MAEALKDAFGPDIPVRIAGMIEPVYPGFKRRAFLQAALRGYEALNLMARGRHIASALADCLPVDFAAAADILLASLGPPLARTENNGMAPFIYLPHTIYVAAHGLAHFEVSMRTLHALTQRFTGEFAIRPFLMCEPERTLRRLAQWAHDPNVHVRRLVSEGTRSRLPWAPRLPAFQKDPQPVLKLLDLLKDDPELYVRRSVANNLNDIGKDHPAILVATARRWMKDASEHRAWIVRHALRSAIKRGESGAFAALDFLPAKQAKVSNVLIAPRRAKLGGRVTIGFDVRNGDAERARLLVDFRIHFVKASGRSAPKTFKLKTLDLAPGETAHLAKTVSLASLTTRKHYPGVHRVEAVINGRAVEIGDFRLIA